MWIGDWPALSLFPSRFLHTYLYMWAVTRSDVHSSNGEVSHSLDALGYYRTLTIRYRTLESSVHVCIHTASLSVSLLLAAHP